MNFINQNIELINRINLNTFFQSINFEQQRLGFVAFLYLLGDLVIK